MQRGRYEVAIQVVLRVSEYLNPLLMHSFPLITELIPASLSVR